MSRLLTFTLLTWTIWRAPTNASKLRMGFKSAFKGLITLSLSPLLFHHCTAAVTHIIRNWWSDIQFKLRRRTSIRICVLLEAGSSSESGNVQHSPRRKPPNTRCPCPSASRVMTLSGNPSSISLCIGTLTSEWVNRNTVTVQKEIICYASATEPSWRA